MRKLKIHIISVGFSKETDEEYAFKINVCSAKNKLVCLLILYKTKMRFLYYYEDIKYEPEVMTFVTFLRENLCSEELSSISLQHVIDQYLEIE